MAFAAVRRSLVGDALGMPDGLGKYKVLERVGAGGMGAVFAAWDPELERRVALKVLVGGTEAAEEQKLIMREAKAAAQLSHPNVVTVFEVGVAQGRVFLAMEYIRGKTLRRWVEAPQRPDAILAVLLQAGRGLAAAHARGLVHRDFKPDNVLVDESGQAKVVDFGLAQSSTEAFDAAAALDTVDARPAPLTQTGTRSGTPDYMAPEALEGYGTDARGDQFSFAVTAWEVLCGTRPFARNDAAEAPRGRPIAGVHRSIIQALTRALAHDPRARFPTMDTLLEALDPAPRAARRTRGLLAGAAVLTVGAVSWAATHQPAIAPCTDLDARLDGVWDARAQASARAAFMDADADIGATAWSSTSQTLDAYAEAWTDASTEACEATRVRGEQSDETYTLQTLCLHGRLRDLGALVGRFETLDAEALRRAPEAARALPSVDACTDPTYLRAQVEPAPPAIEAQANALRDRIATLSSAEDLGQYKAVSEALPALVEDTDALGHRPLRAEVKLLEGRIAHRMGSMPEARAALEASALDATATRHDRVLADALSLLVLVVGFEQQQPEAGLWLADQAGAVLERLGDDPLRVSRLRTHRGLLQLRAGELELARDLLESAEALLATYDPEAAQHGFVFTKLANISIALGQWDRASTELELALAIVEPARGPEHPDVGSILGNQGVVYRNLDRLEDARESFERARAVFATNLGPEHPKVYAVDMNLGNALLQARELETAERMLDRAAKGLEASLGETHLWTIKSINARGLARVLSERVDEGRADHERAIDLLERVAPDALELGNAYCYLGSARATHGDFEGARTAFARGFETFERILGKDAVGHHAVELCRETEATVPSSE